MSGDVESTAALEIPLLFKSESQSPVRQVGNNITYLAADAPVPLSNQSEALFEKAAPFSNLNYTEIALDSEMIESWRFSQNETISVDEESAFVLWFFYFLRCIVIPGLLFYITWILWELRFLRMRDLTNPLPLPSGRMGFPIIGEMIHFFVLGTNYQRERQREYGDVYRTHMFGRPTVMAIGEKHVRRLLLGEGQIVETLWPSMTRKILGEHGIVNGDKQTHTTIKRLALRAFSPRHMWKYAPVVQTGISDHIQKWEGSLSVLELCKQMVSRTMMAVLLGIEPDDPDIKNYIQAADDVINSIFTLPINLPGFAFRKGLQAKEFVFKNLEDKLRSKLEASDEELFSEEYANDCDSILLTIIKIARREGTNIKLINLQNLSLEFIFAGTQSLQCASSSMIVHLSQRPQIVNRLRDEIRKHGLWDKPFNKVSYNDILKLKFADCVINETMRVTPSIPGCVRVATRTFELGGYQVPRGWQVVYSIKLTHESAAGRVLQNGSECFFDPDVYFNCSRCKNSQSSASHVDRGANQSDEPRTDGDRNEHSAARTERLRKRPSPSDHVCENSSGEYSFVPFGKGSRMCAGKNYGLLFLRLMLFELVRTRDFKLDSKVKYSAVPMTKPHKSVMVRFEKIKKQTRLMTS